VIIWLQWRHRTFQEPEIVALAEEAGFELERIYAFPSAPPIADQPWHRGGSQRVIADKRMWRRHLIPTIEI
jgi:hypothetical protein